MSIENQCEMLSRYVREQGWNLYAAYCEVGIIREPTPEEMEEYFQERINKKPSLKVKAA